MEDQRRKYKIEIAQTFLMSAMVLISAWSGYQASAWSGAQSFKIAESYAAGRMASQKALIADNQMLLDGILVVNFAHAVIENRKDVVEFYLQHVPLQLRSSMRGWLPNRLKIPTLGPIHLQCLSTGKKLFPSIILKSQNWGKRRN